MGLGAIMETHILISVSLFKALLKCKITYLFRINLYATDKSLQVCVCLWRAGGVFREKWNLMNPSPLHDRVLVAPILCRPSPTEPVTETSNSSKPSEQP